MSRIANTGRRSVVQVRLRADVKARVADAAAREHRTVSAWIRHLIRRELTAVHTLSTRAPDRPPEADGGVLRAASRTRTRAH